ncbi:MAG: hypothetical protein J6O53_01325 [Eubacterium sp.]|nr:hypothetical protein [Eubacterium sp.]
MNIAIVDDDIKDIELLEGLLRKYASLHQAEITIEAYQEATDFLASLTFQVCNSNITVEP